MTIKIHKTAVTSAGKISQPYILLGPLGHTTVPGKESVVVCVCVCACVCSGYEGMFTIRTRVEGYLRLGPEGCCVNISHPLNIPIWKTSLCPIYFRATVNE